MNIRDEILKEHSKKQSEKIADYIGNNKRRYAELVKLFLSGDYRITQRAAWIVSSCAERYPSLILPYLSKFIEFARNPPDVAVKRNVVRVLSLIELPEQLEGIVYDFCFPLVTSAKEELAVRAYSITVIGNAALKYPDLKAEVCETLLLLKDHDSPAIRSRTKGVLKKLKCKE